MWFPLVAIIKITNLSQFTGFKSPSKLLPRFFRFIWTKLYYLLDVSRVKTTRSMPHSEKSNDSSSDVDSVHEFCYYLNNFNIYLHVIYVYLEFRLKTLEILLNCRHIFISQYKIPKFRQCKIYYRVYQLYLISL